MQLLDRAAAFLLCSFLEAEPAARGKDFPSAQGVRLDGNGGRGFSWLGSAHGIML